MIAPLPSYPFETLRINRAGYPEMHAALDHLHERRIKLHVAHARVVDAARAVSLGRRFSFEAIEVDGKVTGFLPWTLPLAEFALAVAFEIYYRAARALCAACAEELKRPRSNRPPVVL